MAEQSTAHHLREYETIFLVKPDLTDEGVDKLKDRVRGIVNREGGKLIRFTVWGKKKTMYPVAKQPRAIYVHAAYLGGHGLVVTGVQAMAGAGVDPEGRAAEEVSSLAPGELDGCGGILVAVSRDPRAEAWALTACGRLASAFLMGSTFTAMLLGHHYLTAPAMSISPLPRHVGSLLQTPLPCRQ